MTTPICRRRLIHPYFVGGACHEGHDPPEQATGPEKGRPKANSFISPLKHGILSSSSSYFFLRFLFVN
jgi:hypothetical protein